MIPARFFTACSLHIKRPPVKAALIILIILSGNCLVDGVLLESHADDAESEEHQEQEQDT